MQVLVCFLRYCDVVVHLQREIGILVLLFGCWSLSLFDDGASLVEGKLVDFQFRNLGTDSSRLLLMSWGTEDTPVMSAMVVEL